MKKSSIQMIGAFVLLIAIIGLYAFWYTMIQAKVAETNTLSQKISEQTLASSRAEEAKTQLKTLDTEQQTLGQYFISTDDVVPFLERLQTTGTFLKSKVEVVSVSATPGTPYGTLSLSLKITGSFNAVARTLGAIEYSPYDITLTTLTLDSSLGASASSSPEWTATSEFTIGTITDSTTTNSTASSTPSPQAAPLEPVSQPTVPLNPDETTTSTSPIHAS